MCLGDALADAQAVVQVGRLLEASAPLEAARLRAVRRPRHIAYVVLGHDNPQGDLSGLGRMLHSSPGQILQSCMQQAWCMPHPWPIVRLLRTCMVIYTAATWR